MLWSVYDWFQQRSDYTPILRYYEAEAMGIPVEANATIDVESGIGVDILDKQKAHRLHLFIRLVSEGYIDADLRTEIVGGPPFTSAAIRGLSEKGLVEIGELPDPQQKIIQGLACVLSTRSFATGFMSVAKPSRSSCSWAQALFLRAG